MDIRFASPPCAAAQAIVGHLFVDASAIQGTGVRCAKLSRLPHVHE
jgi:hypothetical protein